MQPMLNDCAAAESSSSAGFSKSTVPASTSTTRANTLDVLTDLARLARCSAGKAGSLADVINSARQLVTDLALGQHRCTELVNLCDDMYGQSRSSARAPVGERGGEEGAKKESVEKQRCPQMHRRACDNIAVTALAPTASIRSRFKLNSAAAKRDAYVNVVQEPLPDAASVITNSRLPSPRCTAVRPVWDTLLTFPVGASSVDSTMGML